MRHLNFGFGSLEREGETITLMIDIHSTRAIHHKTRLVLALGFFALLALVAGIGIYSANTLERLSSEEVAEVGRQSRRTALLKQADESLTLATTSVRNCLLGLNEVETKRHVALAHQAWADANETIRQYRIVAVNRAQLTERLEKELALYWRIAEATIRLDNERQRSDATRLFVDRLIPLRDKFLETLAELHRLEWEDLRLVAERSVAVANAAKQRMWMGVGSSWVLALFIVLFTFWRLKNLENSAILSYAEAATAAVELGRLSERLFRSQEVERKRIAREIHDDFGQRMATLLYELSSISERGDATPQLRGAIDSMRERLSELATDIQNLSRGLHSAVLDKIGLEAAIRSDCTSIAGRTHLEVNFQAIGIPRRLPEEIALSVYRVYQEAAQNALKHSHTERLDVTLALENTDLVLRVKDYGIGFEASSLMGQSSLGLVSMRERLRMVGGALKVRTTAPDGTEIEARVPVPRA